MEDMYEGIHKAPGGLIRAFVKLEGGVFSRVVFSGDFILTPEVYQEGLESCLGGASPVREEILSRIASFFESNPFQAPGVDPEDFTEAVLKAVENAKS